MRLTVLALVAVCLCSGEMACATTLPPEFKAYDFGEAYYVEDGGVVISPYDHGFVCADGVETPDGIRVMPGGSFQQFDATRMVVDEYHLVRLNATGTRAFFHERTCRYHVVRGAGGDWRDVIGPQVDSDDFYLSRWRTLEWFDHAFPYLEIHPGAQGWRTRSRY